MTVQHGSRLMRQTVAGLACTLALFLIAWNEIPDGNGSLLSLLGDWIHPALALDDARNAVRVIVGLLGVAGCFYCIAEMGNTLGLIPLFGGRIALSARLAGAVLGVLLTLAAAVLGHLGSGIATTTAMVTPLAAILLALLWLSRQEPVTVARHTGAPPPVLFDLPSSQPPAPATRTEPTVPPPARITQPATFTARPARQADGQDNLAPLDFVPGVEAGSARKKPSSGTDLGLPPLEFTPRASAAPAPAHPAPAAAPRAVPSPVATNSPPMRIGDGLPPLDFPAPAPPPQRPATAAAPGVQPTLDTLDFSLAQWNPQLGGPATPASAAPNSKSMSTPTRPDTPDEPSLGAQAFALDTVTPREQGPRRALLEEEPDLLAQLGSLSQIRTPPSAPIDLPAPRPPEVAHRSAPIGSAAAATKPERVKLADKGVFTIYKLVDAGQIVAYALTEHGATVAVGTQEQVKQVLRERWHGPR